MRVLITRPEPDASVLAERLAAAGDDPVCYPLLHFRPSAIEASEFNRANGLIITSGYGVRALSGFPGIGDIVGLPLYCVGEETARKARGLGFSRIDTISETAEKLAEEISDRANGLLVHVTGLHQAFDLQEALAKRGLYVRKVSVYAMEACATLDECLLQELQDRLIDGVILMSPRTTEIFVSLCEKHGLRTLLAELVYFCISPTVAARLAPIVARRIRIAARPTRQAIIDLLAAERRANGLSQPQL